MLWSSIGKEGYAMGTALSEGSILGPWRLSAEPLVKTDGGHGMAFRGFDGALYICFHSPNDTPNERFRYLRAFEAAGGLEL